MLIAMGYSRLGFIANFLSHPVISGFITASGMLIAASQLKYVLGVQAGGAPFYEIIVGLVSTHRPDQLYAATLGSAVVSPFSYLSGFG